MGICKTKSQRKRVTNKDTYTIHTTTSCLLHEIHKGGSKNFGGCVIGCKSDLDLKTLRQRLSEVKEVGLKKDG